MFSMRQTRSKFARSGLAAANAAPFGCNGGTLWLTGLSGAGKTTVAYELKKQLQKSYPESSPVILDGDELRETLNKDLGFSKESREENIRRVSEVAKLIANEGQVSIVSLISPFIADREKAKARHQEAGIPFFEVHVNTSIEECENRDPKGLYKKVRKNQIKQFTGIHQGYEFPPNPDHSLVTEGRTVAESANELVELLKSNNVLTNERSDLVNLFVPEDQKADYIQKAQSLPKVQMDRISTEWVKVLSEGWATPLDNFMGEKELLQTLHFKKVPTADGKATSHSVPIVLPISSEVAKSIEGKSQITLQDDQGRDIAILTNPSAYSFSKEELSARFYGIHSDNHPGYAAMYKDSGDVFLTGEKLEVLDKIEFDDDLNSYRLTPAEIKAEVEKRGGDALFVFQLRNPIHNGHAELLSQTRNELLKRGYKNPILLVHTVGGWTKDDDVSLEYRMKQYQALLDDGTLNPDTTIVAIWPSPMFYAGPSEVLWHAKSRYLCGCDYYIVGRDPAGIKHPEDDSNDLYDAFHGQKVLAQDELLAEGMTILPFKMVHYNKELKKMELYNEANKDKYESISGSRMRKMAREGEQPPEGFMSPNGWKVLVEFYQKKAQQQ